MLAVGTLEPRQTRWLAGIAIGGAGALFALVGSRSLITGRLLPVAALIAALTVYVVALHPRFTTVLLVVLMATFFWVPIAPIAVAGVRSDAAEVVVAVFIFAHGIRPMLAGVRLPYTRGLLLLVVAVACGAAFAALHGGTRYTIVGYAKEFAFYLLVLPVVGLFRAPAQKRWLERIILATGGVCSALTVLATATGYQLQGRPGFTFDPLDVTQTVRVRPPFLALLFIATLLLFARIVLLGATPGRIALMGVYVAPWAISFNRSSWVALLVAAAIYLRARPGPRHPSRAIAASLVAVILLPALFVVAATGALGAIPAGVAQRVTTIGEGGVLRSDSYADRAKEQGDAIRALRRSPIFGVGLGNPYGARRPYYDAWTNRVIYTDRPFSHNSWVFLYLDAGLLGVAAFGCIVTEAIRQGRRTARSDDLLEANAAVAAGAALVGAALEALFNPNLLGRPNILAFAFALALLTPAATRELEPLAKDRL